MDPLELTRELVDIDSTTGREGEAGRWLAGRLRAAGFSVTEQPVDDTRFNVLATAGPPAVVLSTHFDCVPPFFPSRVDGDRLYGRGSCDAKGILAAQVAAADRVAQGRRDARRPPVRRRRRARQRRRQARQRRGDRRMSLPGRRRADRQSPWAGDARHPAREASRVRPCLPLVVSIAWRVGDRQVGRRDRGAQGDRSPGGRSAREDALHGRADQRRRGAQRRLAVGRSRGHVPHGVGRQRWCVRR